MATSSSQYADLAEKIRERADSGKPVETDLATNQRIISRVTDGIYREPWAAFRELIANAYDADATSVTVETGAPDFEKVTVRDNGNGMSPDTLAYMLRNIGGSSKRTRSGAALLTSNPADLDLSPAGRPLIGKIGIGMFAVAQLTQHFQIVTKAKGDRVRSSATVLLKTYNEKELRDADPDDEYVAGRVRIISETVDDGHRSVSPCPLQTRLRCRQLSRPDCLGDYGSTTELSMAAYRRPNRSKTRRAQIRGLIRHSR